MLTKEMQEAVDSIIKGAEVVATMLPGKDRDQQDNVLRHQCREFGPAMALRLKAADHELEQKELYIKHLHGVLNEAEVDYE